MKTDNLLHLSPVCTQNAGNTSTESNQSARQGEAGVGRVPLNSFHNLFLFEGPRHEVQRRVDTVKQGHPDAMEETSDETSRHRAFFASETGGFRTEPSPEHVTISLHFETEPPPDPWRSCAALLYAKDLVDTAGTALQIAYGCIDTQRVPWAVGVALCSASTQGIVGTLGGNRKIYFDIMRHFFYDDDPHAFFQHLATEQAVGQLPYNHREQWSESVSPLRLEFRTPDPNRNGWSLSMGSSSELHDFLIRDGFLPPAQTCISTHVPWLNSLMVMLMGEPHGILPHFDEDGQLMVSGYALHAAGVIDKRLKPTCDLTKDQRIEFGLGDRPSEERAMIAVLKLYVGFLLEALHHIDAKNAPGEWKQRLRDHLDTAAKWLIEHGHLRQVCVQPGSEAVN